MQKNLDRTQYAFMINTHQNRNRKQCSQSDKGYL